MCRGYRVVTVCMAQCVVWECRDGNVYITHCVVWECRAGNVDITQCVVWECRVGKVYNVYITQCLGTFCYSMLMFGDAALGSSNYSMGCVGMRG